MPGNEYLKRYRYSRRLDKHYFLLIDSKHLKKVCYFCLEELEPGQIMACSPECLKQIDLRSSPGLLRQEIITRDGMTCNHCGVNGIFLRKALKILKKAYPEEYVKKLEEIRIPPSRANRPSNIVDVDHIIPVSQGGGAGMNGDIRTNAQILCLLCHHHKDNKPRKGSK